MTDVRASVVSMSARHPDGDDAHYLRWHGLDHLPEQYRISGLRHGARWVSTPECREARLASAPRFDATDHLLQYLFTDPLDAALDGFFSLGRELHDAGRMPLRLPAVELAGYRFDGAVASTDAMVDPAVLPWRPARGVEVVVEEGTTTTPLAALVEVDGVAGCWTYTGTDALDSRLTPTDGLRLTVLYLDDDPLAVADRLRAPIAERWDAPAITPLLAAPFHAVAPFAWDSSLP